MEQTPPNEHKVVTSKIPISLEKEVCFKAYRPEVISKNADNINAKFLFRMFVFKIQVDIIEKIIIYPPILKILSNEFRIHLSKKLFDESVLAILNLVDFDFVFKIIL